MKSSLTAWISALGAVDGGGGNVQPTGQQLARWRRASDAGFAREMKWRNADDEAKGDGLSNAGKKEMKLLMVIAQAELYRTNNGDGDDQ